MFDSATLTNHWYPVLSTDTRATALFKRHYSYRQKNYITKCRSIIAPGEHICLITLECNALFIWSAERFRKDNQIGINCSVFRNESTILSSELIREADDIAWRKWPGERHFTFVNAQKIKHKRDPGRCFIKADWSKCGVSKGGLIILERRFGNDCNTKS